MPPEENMKGALFPDGGNPLSTRPTAMGERPGVVQGSHAQKQPAPIAAREKIALGKPVLLPEMEEAALDALRNDKFLRGDNVFKFEEEFARFVGTDYAVSTSSGTNALQFILISLGIKGKKVVTTPMSFIASANAIIQADATPVFADISERDYCLDAREAGRQLQAGASGILPVHIFGQPVDFAGFQSLADKYHVPVVEDACQAHGAKYDGRTVGSLGVAGAFSFYPSKNMTVLGDGGMVTTNDEKIAKDVSKLRDGGRMSWYEHDMLGYTSRLSSVHAAIGRVQLRHLEEWNRRRREIAGIYSRELATTDEVKLPPAPTRRVEPVYHQFVIRAKGRDALKDYLGVKGIECGIHYPIPIHLQPLYRTMFGFREGDYPKSERLASECLSLPMHPFLTNEEARYVCENVSEYYAKEKGDRVN